MATGQYLTQFAVKLAEHGHAVTVVTSDRGYDDPSLRFPRQETWKNISIIRVPSFSPGKETKWRRAVNFSSFLTTCAFRLILLPSFDAVVSLTSPPLISFLGSWFVRLKGGRLFFWVMDLNPDEAIAAGWLKQDSLTGRVLARFLETSLHQATAVVVLDRFMKDRVIAKGTDKGRISIIPPWSNDDEVGFTMQGRQAFRARHDLAEKFVVMYSGNHSPCHPLDTLLEAARRLAARSEFVFCFVGGGSEQTKVRKFAAEHRLSNVRCLPYQPLGELSDSLSAADLHTVVIGEEFVGIVHPCKVYNIMAIGTPCLYIGPTASHVTDIKEQTDCDDQFYLAQHGDVDGVLAGILAAAVRGKADGRRRYKQTEQYSKQSLLPRMIELLESGQMPAVTSQKRGRDVVLASAVHASSDDKESDKTAAPARAI